MPDDSAKPGPAKPNGSKSGPAITRSSGANLLAACQYEFSMEQLDTASLREAIYSVPLSDSDEQLTSILVKSKQRDHALMRINRALDIRVDGSLGHYAFALCSEAEMRCEGHVGNGVAEGMSSGTVRVRGNAGDGAGAAMTGGTLAVYGSAGDRCGGAMRGGGVFVRGNVGDHCGVGALGGLIVIGGDAGDYLGDAMSDVTVFIRGKAKSLADGVTEAPLRKRELLRLGLLLLNASIRGEAKDFRRIVPKALLEAEEAGRGEVNPSWRS
jgi:hypothetical protein